MERPSAAELSFRQLIDSLPDLVCAYDLDGKLAYVNHSYAEFHGATPDEMIGRRILDLVPPETARALKRHLDEIKDCTPDRPMRVNQSRVIDVSGAVRWHEWTDKAVFDEEQRIVSFVAVGRDVTDRVRAEEDSRFHALRDGLTELLNRRSVIEELTIRLRSIQGDGHVGLLFVDLDDFKDVNDRGGHRAGDDCLINVARALERVSRDRDLVGRMGGDEFVIITDRIASAEAAETTLNALADRLERELAGLSNPVGASVGRAVSRLGDDAGSLLHRADTGMYREKWKRK